MRGASSRWTVLSQLAGSGALFAALLFLPGFLSLRAYHNMLGLPVDLAISYGDYLIAGVRFFASTLLSAAALVIVALVPVLVAAALLPWLRSNERAGRVASWTWRRLQSPVVVAVLNVLGGAFLAYTLLLLRKPLDQRNLLFEGGVRSETYVLLELLCMVSAVVAWLLVTRVNRVRPIGTVFSAMIVILLSAELLLLPMAYGTLEMPTDLPRVAQIGNVPVTGRMFLAGRDPMGNYVIYDADRGTIAVMPNVQVVLGRREDVLDALR